MIGRLLIKIGPCEWRSADGYTVRVSFGRHSRRHVAVVFSPDGRQVGGAGDDEASALAWADNAIVMLRAIGGAA